MLGPEAMQFKPRHQIKLGASKCSDAVTRKAASGGDTGAQQHIYAESSAPSLRRAATAISRFQLLQRSFAIINDF